MKNKRTEGKLWKAGILSWLLIFGLAANLEAAGRNVFASGLTAGLAVMISDTEAEGQTVPSELRQLYARGAVLMDGDSGRILFGKNETEILPMASTTKIMTCILALELGDPKEICQVTEKAAAQPQVHLGMRSGETYYLGDLIYSMMLESHNDSAVCVAEHIGDSVEGFAELMNQKAGEIGCEQTHYITPNGLDGEDEEGCHSTTAADLARVMRYCVMESEKREEFMKITQTASYNFSDVSGKRNFSCSNHNALLNMMDGVLSGKTGFTGKAGYCYVGAVKKDGKTLIGALLACGWPGNKGYKWVDMRKLLNYGFSSYERKQIDLSDLEIPPVTVLHGVEEQVGIEILPEKSSGASEGIQEKGGNMGMGQVLETPSKKCEVPSLTILAKPEEKAEIKIELKKTVEAPVQARKQAGKLTCFVGGETIAEFSLGYEEEVERIDYYYCLKIVAESFFPGSSNV